jgi:Uma2 family endonuclease
MTTRIIKPNNGVAASAKPANGDEIDYYYDRHPTEEDLMGESAAQTDLIHYLRDVLTILYLSQTWFIACNLNIYMSGKYKEAPIVPDLAVFKDVVLTRAQRLQLRSWKMWQTGRPAPSVTFEISSDATWLKDLEDKPAQYAKLGVKEYFAYDPNEPQEWRDKTKRLRGWRYQASDTGIEIVELSPNEQGWLWSEELDNWLVPDLEYLRLYTKDKTRCLTAAEKEHASFEKEHATLETLLAKLRAKNIDPDAL